MLEERVITLGDSVQKEVVDVTDTAAETTETTETKETTEVVETTEVKEVEITDEAFVAKYGFTPSEYEDLKKEREELINANPYKSEQARQIDELISGGMDFDSALEFIKLDASKLTPMQKVILHTKQTLQGEFTDAEIIEYINNDLLENYDPEEKLSIKQQAKLQELTKKAEEFIEGKKNSLKSEAPSRSSIVEERQNIARIKEWGSIIPSVVKNKVEFTFGDKEKPLKINLDLNEADTKELQETLQTYTENYDVSAKNAEDKEKLAAYAKNVVILKNIDKLLALSYKQGLSNKTKEIIEREENPNLGVTRKYAPSEGRQITFHN